MENFQIEAFFYSSYGKICSITVLILTVIAFVYFLRKKHFLSPKAITYSAISIALAMLLSNIKLFHMPFGGSISACSMIFISFIGYWFGAAPGLIAAVSYGVLQLVVEPYVIHPVQLIFDYILAFGALGVSGFFSSSKHGLLKGYISGSLLRWLFSTLSGAIFFASYAKDWNMSPIPYSALYNILYIAPEMVLSVMLVSIPSFKKAIDEIKYMGQ